MAKSSPTMYIKRVGLWEDYLAWKSWKRELKKQKKTRKIRQLNPREKRVLEIKRRLGHLK